MEVTNYEDQFQEEPDGCSGWARRDAEPLRFRYLNYENTTTNLEVILWRPISRRTWWMLWLCTVRCWTVTATYSNFDPDFIKMDRFRFGYRTTRFSFCPIGSRRRKIEEYTGRPIYAVSRFSFVKTVLHPFLPMVDWLLFGFDCIIGTWGGDDMELGQRLKEARCRSGMTREELAKQLGVSRQTIYNWETGVSQT